RVPCRRSTRLLFPGITPPVEIRPEYRFARAELQQKRLVERRHEPSLVGCPPPGQVEGETSSEARLRGDDERRDVSYFLKSTAALHGYLVRHIFDLYIW